MSDLAKKVEENQSDLRELANADLSCSWIAEALLESTEGVSSYQEKEATEKPVIPTEQPENQTQEGIFAY